MKWTEIITLRTSETPVKEVVADILKSVGANSSMGKPAKLKLFSHATVESDLSSHIQWEATSMDRGKSLLGFELVDMLREFGLVNHSVWIEEETDGGEI